MHVQLLVNLQRDVVLAVDRVREMVELLVLF